MEFAEVKQWLDANKGDASVKSYLEGFSPLAGLTDENTHSLVESNKSLRAYRDRAVTKAIETYREKTLPGLIDEEMKKRHPEETPEQKRIRELEQKLAERERREQETARKERLRAKAKEIGYDPDLAADFAVYDEDAALSILTRHVEWDKAREARVRNELLVKGGGPTPKAGEPKGSLTREQLDSRDDWSRVLAMPPGPDKDKAIADRMAAAGKLGPE